MTVGKKKFDFSIWPYRDGLGPKVWLYFLPELVIDWRKIWKTDTVCAYYVGQTAAGIVGTHKHTKTTWEICLCVLSTQIQRSKVPFLPHHTFFKQN